MVDRKFGLRLDLSQYPSVSERISLLLLTGRATHWSRLSAKLGREATNLEHLSFYWDWEDWLHRGLGKDLCFVRALPQLKVKESISLRGFYAQPWPHYLEREIGIVTLIPSQPVFKS